ncbi:TPA: hypothetical protein ACH3X2_005033 [Trebouxia sp. C0005]
MASVMPEMPPVLSRCCCEGQGLVAGKVHLSSNKPLTRGPGMITVTVCRISTQTSNSQPFSTPCYKHTHTSVHYLFELAVTPLILFGCDKQLKGPYCLCRHSNFSMH